MPEAVIRITFEGGKRWDWLVTEETLDRFGTGRREKRKRYRWFVEDGLQDDEENSPVQTAAGDL
jgi:hypothetical protein